MSHVGRDLQYAIRSLARTPGATSAAVLALTLGVGLTTTMFSLVYGVLGRGLPYPDGDQIVIAYRDNPARGETRQAMPFTVFADFRREQRSLAALGGTPDGIRRRGVGARLERPVRVSGSGRTRHRSQSRQRLAARVAGLLGARRLP